MDGGFSWSRRCIVMRRGVIKTNKQGPLDGSRLPVKRTADELFNAEQSVR